MSSEHIDNSGQQAADALADQILRAVAGIRFGSVEIIIHEGQVVQLERREKVRLDNDGFLRPRAAANS